MADILIIAPAGFLWLLVGAVTSLHAWARSTRSTRAAIVMLVMIPIWPALWVADLATRQFRSGARP